jgi:hypothetical protein
MKYYFDPSFNIVNKELSTLRLYIGCIYIIFCYSSIVHDQKGSCFKDVGNWNDDFLSIIRSIVKERFSNLDQANIDIFNCCTYKATTSDELPEFIPVFMFIFKLLKKQKLDFKYGTIPLKMFSGLDHLLTRISAELEIEKILDSDVESTLDEDDIERALYNREEAAKYDEINRMMEMMNLPDIVEAYFNVYGKLPDNYPVVEEE